MQHVISTTSARQQRRFVAVAAVFFAAALGGADSIACAPFDAAIGPSDAFAPAAQTCRTASGRGPWFAGRAWSTPTSGASVT